MLVSARYPVTQRRGKNITSMESRWLSDRDFRKPLMIASKKTALVYVGDNIRVGYIRDSGGFVAAVYDSIMYDAKPSGIGVGFALR